MARISKSSRKTASQLVLISGPDQILDAIDRTMPESAKETLIDSEWNIDEPRMIFATGSGFETRRKRQYPQIDKATNSSISGIVENKKVTGKQYVDEAIKHIKSLVTKNGEPVSTGEVFGYFLEQNTGNIGESLIDTAIFLKYSARNNFQTGDYGPSEKNTAWFRENILDEFGRKSRSNLQNPKEEINLLGKDYHGWDIVAKLIFLPSQVVEAGTIFRQVSHLGAQGVDKLESDLYVTTKLKDVERVLTSIA